MKLKSEIQAVFRASIAIKAEVLKNDSLLDAIERAAMTLVDTFRSGHRLYVCGNGGSAADAQHIAAEFSGRFYVDRKALPAEALHVNTSFLTAVANDYGYEDVFRRAVEAQGRPDDVLIGISTSGNSENVVRAQREAKKRGMKVVALTGKNGGKMRKHCDILIPVPSVDTPRIQESHILIGHILAELTERQLFKKRSGSNRTHASSALANSASDE